MERKAGVVNRAALTNTGNNILQLPACRFVVVNILRCHYGYLKKLRALCQAVQLLAVITAIVTGNSNVKMFTKRFLIFNE
jgi:hypothetical protein